jgi:hypothetical protein
MAAEIEPSARALSRPPSISEDSKERPQTLEARGGQAKVPERSSGHVGWVPLALSLVAAVGGVTAIGAAAWQASTMFTSLVEVVRPAGAARTTPPRSAAAAPPLASPPRAKAPVPSTAAVSLVTIDERDATRSKPSGASFEAKAEVHEAPTPVGLVDDALMVPGEAPPPSYPRTRCDDVFVYIVTIAEGAPERSAASLGLGKTGPARFRQLGETIGDYTVLSITDDSTGLNPAVWLGKEGAACRAELAGNPARVHVPLPVRKNSVAKPRRKRRRRR